MHDLLLDTRSLNGFNHYFLTLALKINFFSAANADNIWGKVFKNEPSKICVRQPLKHLK